MRHVEPLALMQRQQDRRLPSAAVNLAAIDKSKLREQLTMPGKHVMPFPDGWPRSNCANMCADMRRLGGAAFTPRHGRWRSRRHCGLARRGTGHRPVVVRSVGRLDGNGSHGTAAPSRPMFHV